MYAIGEILLVVIGILIALSINNWNQQKLDRITENNYLRAIVNELKSNNEIDDQLIFSRMDKKINSLLLAKAYAEGRHTVENQKEFINAVGYGAVFSGSYFLGDDDVFKELVSTGNLSLLIDSEIKEAIIIYYNSQESYFNRSKIHASSYLDFTNKIKPFDSQNISHISEYDQAEAMEAYKTSEFREIIDKELSYTYKIRDYVTNQARFAKNAIDLIEKKLNKPEAKP